MSGPGVIQRMIPGPVVGRPNARDVLDWYVSPNGTGDGLSVGSPTTFDGLVAAFGAQELIGFAYPTVHVLLGTYTAGPSGQIDLLSGYTTGVGYSGITFDGEIGYAGGDRAGTPVGYSGSVTLVSSWSASGQTVCKIRVPEVDFSVNNADSPTTPRWMEIVGGLRDGQRLRPTWRAEWGIPTDHCCVAGGFDFDIGVATQPQTGDAMIMYTMPQITGPYVFLGESTCSNIGLGPLVVAAHRVAVHASIGGAPGVEFIYCDVRGLDLRPGSLAYAYASGVGWPHHEGQLYATVVTYTTTSPEFRAGSKSELSDQCWCVDGTLGVGEDAGSAEVLVSGIMATKCAGNGLGVFAGVLMVRAPLWIDNTVTGGASYFAIVRTGAKLIYTAGNKPTIKGSATSVAQVFLGGGPYTLAATPTTNNGADFLQGQ